MGKYRIKRSARRIAVAMPLQLNEGSAVTRDVSTSGVYFYTDQAPALGMPLHFVLEFRYTSPEVPFKLHCQGTVVRAEKAGTKNGVAATIEAFSSAV